MQLELWWKGTLASSDSFKQRPRGLFEKELAYELTNSCSDIEVADCPACSRSCYLPFVFVICFYVCIYDRYCFRFVLLLLFCCMWGCWLCGPTSALVRRLPPLRHSSAIRAIHPDISTPTQIYEPCGNINVETRNTHQYRDTAGLEYKPSLARIEEWGRKNKMVLSIKYFEWWMTRSDAMSTQVSSFVKLIVWK